MAMSIAQIQSILRQRGSPMAAELPALAREAQAAGVPLSYVLGIAGAESEFGTTGYAKGRHNPFGYGIHQGLDYPSYAAATRAMLKGIKSGTYHGAKTIADIAKIYAPSSENDTGRYTQNVARIASMFGSQYNPNSVVVGDGTGAPLPDLGGATPTDPGAAAPGMGLDTPAGKLQMLEALKNMGNNKDKMAQLSALLTIRALKGGGQAAANPGGAPAAPGAPGAVPQGTKYGGVDSALAYKGGEGGDWGGSMELALQLAKAVGLPIASQKRSRKLTASGNPSDHWIGSTHSYATDLATSGAAGDTAWTRMMNYLARRYNQPSLRSVQSGAWRDINLGGYRYQLGWEVPGHFDHIHAGIRRI